MIDGRAETALREWYRAEAAPVASPGLRRRIAGIPDAEPVPDQAAWRRVGLLVAATLLLGGALFGGAIVAGSFAERLPVDPLIVPNPAAVDACALFDRAIDRAGALQGSMRSEHGALANGGRVCANDGWDATYADRHFVFYPRPVTGREAPHVLERLGDLLDSPAAPFAFEGWEEHVRGMWIGTWAYRGEVRPNELPAEERSYFATAVSADPYFFVVTGGSRAETRRIAEAVLLELREAVP